MDKTWHRGAIKYLLQKGLASKDIHADMVATLGDTLLHMQQSKGGHFKMGKDSLGDDDRYDSNN